MGQIADDIISGMCCALCGQYFVAQKPEGEWKWDEQSDELFEHGYPVACKECWEPNCGYEKATAEII